MAAVAGATYRGLDRRGNSSERRHV